MRTPKELEDVLFADWDHDEIIRACLDGSYPEDADVRKNNLEVILPYLSDRYDEERIAHDEMVRENPRSAFVKEWGTELEIWKDLIDRGIYLGALLHCWHTPDAVCPKCDVPLKRMEKVLCYICKNK